MLLRALGATALVTACAAVLFAPAPSKASGPVSLFQWEDYMDPPFLAGYKRTYHESPDITIFADEDEAFAKMRAGYKPDVMGPCYYEFPRWQEAGFIQPIDTTKLKNWNKLSGTRIRVGQVLDVETRSVDGLLNIEAAIGDAQQYIGYRSDDARSSRRTDHHPHLAVFEDDGRAHARQRPLARGDFVRRSLD